MSTTDIKCGYLPLVDCAPLIIAKELTFAAQEGLNLTLMRQPSWSALRDRLAFGHLHFAHMLSPMPLAMSLGLGSVPAKMDALMVLSVNGTVIGVSADLDQKMRATGWAPCFDDPASTSKALFAAAEGPLRIGVPFPYSMHRMLLEYWLKQDPNYSDRAIKILTIPPHDMAEAVRSGRLDMFCVGEPWGSVAVQDSEAALLLPGSAIWRAAPEKVLGARHEWIEENPDICKAMVRAVYKACRWLDQPENTPLAVEILARSQHLDLPDHAIDPALTKRITTRQNNAPTRVEHFLRFHDYAANFPWQSQACWISDQLSEGTNLDALAAREAARACFRSDIYSAALHAVAADIPQVSEKLEGALDDAAPLNKAKGGVILGPDRFFDGAVFNFAQVEVIKN